MSSRMTVLVRKVRTDVFSKDEAISSLFFSFCETITSRLKSLTIVNVKHTGKKFRDFLLRW